ncbi:alpha/beta hydrolase fold domain-containing protein [Arthrobacter bambusae]|uniref:Acetyl esterase/lipase n=1 Tax=Arthrobacter bambusae TaxID=1338426 RepID=A0AAW8DHK5_9MICC|nr:alpha/beta hydrolase [Arthrobacter bambusae]MDP9904749.1 acetyl esterase/lipase [Arthrobacter bambusae]MDQ0129565.1 acetyl esterase/lipase [Arthrobacter bambusae]MDQ0180822.1 acetyl esterase/lipase [Arthrobacter bambusae]
MSSEKMSVLGKLMPSIMKWRKANKNYVTREAVRLHLDHLVLHPRSTSAPKRHRPGVRVEAAMVEGWRVFTISPVRGRSRGTIMYLHGGGWIHEASSYHWKLIEQLAEETSSSVVMPVYPLAHEGGTAAGVVPFVARLSQQYSGPLTLMGDSAGGSIAMSASLLLKNQGCSPALTVLISPALDLRMSNPEIDTVQALDPWLVKRGQLELVEMWAGDDVNDPVLNPILGELGGLSRLLVFSGTRDILNPDTRLFVEQARGAGVDVEYHEKAGHIHVYPLLPIPEGKQARRQIVQAVLRIPIP